MNIFIITHITIMFTTVLLLSISASIVMKKRNTSWFKKHRAMSGIGFIDSVAGFTIVYLYKNKLSQVHFSTLHEIFGLISFFPYLYLVSNLKERVHLIPDESESFLHNIGYVFKNPACRFYMIYDGITIAIYNVLVTSLTFIFAWTIGYENPYATDPIDIIGLIPYAIFPIVGFLTGLYLQFYIPDKRDLKTLLLFVQVKLFHILS